MTDFDRLRHFIGIYIDNVIGGLEFRTQEKVRQPWV